MKTIFLVLIAMLIAFAMCQTQQENVATLGKKIRRGTCRIVAQKIKNMRQKRIAFLQRFKLSKVKCAKRLVHIKKALFKKKKRN